MCFITTDLRFLDLVFRADISTSALLFHKRVFLILNLETCSMHGGYNEGVTISNILSERNVWGNNIKMKHLECQYYTTWLRTQCSGDCSEYNCESSGFVKKG